MNIKETFNNKKFFIVGVGGSGMSSIAKYLTESGAIVFGYDQRKSLVTNQLLKLGIKVTHDIDFEIEQDTLVITSSAINDENSLVQKARLQGLSIINRPEFLSDLTSQYKTIGIAGTHGKTTTTALLSHIYQYNNINHSYIYGGMTSFSGIGGHCGDSSSLVIEADEAFRTFINFDLNDLILTNIDDDHIDHYGSFEIMVDSFKQLVMNTKNVSILNIDDPIINEIQSNIDAISYGEHNSSDYQYLGNNIAMCNGYEVEFKPKIPGRHFMINALGATANAHMNGIELEEVVDAVNNFHGVKRRLELVGNSKEISIYDDYGHHPTEMESTIEALKHITKGNLFVIFQPHRYTRTEKLYERFVSALSKADYSIILDIYSAGEDPIPGISSKVLLEEHKQDNIQYMNSSKKVIEYLSDSLAEGDTVLTLGAGDITLMGPKIMEFLND